MQRPALSSLTRPLTLSIRVRVCLAQGLEGFTAVAAGQGEARSKIEKSRHHELA
jgi:hypothetical protein